MSKIKKIITIFPRHKPLHHINSQLLDFITLFILYLLPLSPIISNQLISTLLSSSELELRIQDLLVMHLLKALGLKVE
jgi:hypothetical protein